VIAKYAVSNTQLHYIFRLSSRGFQQKQ